MLSAAELDGGRDAPPGDARPRRARRRREDGDRLPPTVGDWLLVDDTDAGPHARTLAPRRTALVRDTAGGTSRVQALAANIDVVLVVEHLDPEPQLGRVERLLTLAWRSGARPVVVLTKADLVPDPAGMADEVAAVALAVDVHAVSVPTGEGLDAAARAAGPGRHARRRRSVRRRQVDAGQRAGGPRRHGDRRATVGRPRPAHHDAPRARPAGGRRDAHRHPGHPRRRPGRGRRRAGHHVRGRRGAGRGVPVRRLPPRGGAGVRDPGGAGQRGAARASVRELAPAGARGRVPGAADGRPPGRAGEAPLEAADASSTSAACAARAGPAASRAAR